MFLSFGPNCSNGFWCLDYAKNPDNLLNSAANEDILAHISEKEPSSNLNF